MRLFPAVVIACAAAFATSARPASAGTTGATGLRAHVEAVEDEVVGAAHDLLAGDVEGAGVRLAEARSRIEAALPLGGGALARRVRAAEARLRRAEAALPKDAADVGDCVRALGRVAGAVRAVLRRIGFRGDVTCALTDVSPGPSAFRRPGANGRFRARLPAQYSVVVHATSEDPLFAAVLPDVSVRRGGRLLVRWGPDAGRGSVVISIGVATATRPVINVGPPGALSAPIPAAPTWPGLLTGRVDTDITPFPPGSAPAAAAWTSDGLPAGLSVDPATGVVSGRPLLAGPASTVSVTVRNARAAASSEFAADIDPALPAGVIDLVPGFGVEALLSGAETPVKLDVAPDGRIFYNELQSGRIRVLAADGTLEPEPWATVPVLTGGECGLLGLALAPDFATSGAVFVYASTEAGDGKPRRNRVLRYVEAAGVVTGPEVVIDDLPLGPNQVQNAGDLRFGPDGNLYVSVGDTGDAALAQSEGSLAGRVLRYTAGGAVPVSNPIAGSPEFCRGLRNSFDLAFRASDGILFATENGPTAHDELNVIRANHNFEWGAEEGTTFGVRTGFRVTDWTPVIAPTGLVFHPGTGFGELFRDVLFVASYDAVDVRTLELDGVDLLFESEFLRFDPDVFGNRPLDLAVEADGSLLIATFSAIWRVRRD